jgi:hypothetical protein
MPNNLNVLKPIDMKYNKSEISLSSNLTGDSLSFPGKQQNVDIYLI